MLQLESWKCRVTLNFTTESNNPRQCFKMRTISLPPALNIISISRRFEELFLVCFWFEAQCLRIWLFLSKHINFPSCSGFQVELFCLLKKKAGWLRNRIFSKFCCFFSNCSRVSCFVGQHCFVKEFVVGWKTDFFPEPFFNTNLVLSFLLCGSASLFKGLVLFKFDSLLFQHFNFCDIFRTTSESFEGFRFL
jgi:hypothetical protein